MPELQVNQPVPKAESYATLPRNKLQVRSLAVSPVTPAINVIDQINPRPLDKPILGKNFRINHTDMSINQWEPF